MTTSIFGRIKRGTLGIIVTVLALVLVLKSPSQGAELTNTTSSIRTKATDPDTLLQEMGEYLGELKQFSLEADLILQKISASGEKYEVSESIKLSVKRPNMLHARVIGESRNREFIYDGATATMIDWAHNVVGRLDTPDTLDEMLDFMVDHYGVVWPLADFVYSEPHEVLRQQTQRGIHKGIEDVGSMECHHLDFQQDKIDWQVWIRSGETPLPQKLRIVYKEPGPLSEFNAVIKKWETQLELEDTIFIFQPNKDLMPIKFIRISEETVEEQ